MIQTTVKPFNEFLTEAKFSDQGIEKVLTIFIRLLSKKIGQHLYRNGGPGYYQDIEIRNHPGKGKGFLFFTPKKIAVRLNFVKGELVSMNLWKAWQIGKGSDFYFDFGGANIVKIINLVTDKVKDAIHGQKIAGEIPLTVGELTEGYMLTEAKLSPYEFYQMAQRAYPNKSEDDFKKFHKSEIANVAAMNNLGGRGWNAVKDFPVDKGFYDIVPGSHPKNRGGAGEAAAAIPNDGKKRYLKITIRDPVSNKFLSAADDEISQQLYAKFDAAMKDNSPEMAKKEIKDPASLFGALANLTKLVIKGTNKSLLIYGGPGTGKSFTVTTEFKDAGLVKNKDWFHVKGKITTQSLYQLLFMHRKEKIICFDDCDSVFGSEDSGNILKAALDSYDERILSWISPRTQNVSLLNDAQREAFNDEVQRRLEEDPLAEDEVDEETGKVVKKKPLKYPSEFRYDGRIIFISNLAEKDLDTAVLSRSFKINMDLTDEQMFMRMEQVLRENGQYFGNENLSIDDKVDTMRILKERHALGELKKPQMRTFVVACNIRASGIPDWFDLLQYS